MLSKDPYLSEKDFRFIVQDIGPQLVPYLSVEERLAGLTVEERVAGLSLEECLAGLSAEERLAGLSLEELLAGLPIEEIEAYLKRLKSESSSNRESANK